MTALRREDTVPGEDHHAEEKQTDDDAQSSSCFSVNLPCSPDTVLPASTTPSICSVHPAAPRWGLDHFPWAPHSTH